MRENVKLFRIEDYNDHEPQLIEGFAKITDSFITFKTKDVFSRWETKTHGRNLGRIYHETPAAAWIAYREAQAQRKLDAEMVIEAATGNIDVANEALNTLYGELRSTEVK